MNKKDYRKPTMVVVKLRQQTPLLVSGPSAVGKIGGNLTGDDVINYGGGGDSSNPAYSRRGGSWDGWDE